MGWGAAFVTGAANQLNNDYAANAKLAQQQVLEMSANFDNNIMPEYRKQLAAADQAVTNKKALMAYDGMDDSVATNAVSTPGFDPAKADIPKLLADSRATKAAAKVQPPTPPQPDASGSPSQASTGQDPSQATPAPGQAPMAPTAAPSGPTQAPGQQAAPQQGAQAQSGQAQAPQAPTAQPQTDATGRQLPPPPPPVDLSKANLPVLSQIGDLLTGKVGNDQIRQQFLQEVGTKYGLNESQVLQIVAQANQHAAAKTAAPGSIVNTPSTALKTTAAQTFDNPDAANKFANGDLAGAVSSQRAQDVQDSNDDSQQSLNNSLALADRQHANHMAEKNAESTYPDDTLRNMVNMSILSGKNPQWGRGTTGADVKAYNNMYNQVMQENGWTPGDVVEMQAAVKSGQSGLVQLEKSREAMETNAQTAVLNAHNALQLINGGGAGSPNLAVVSRWINAGRKDIVGDPEVNALNGYMKTLGSEYGRVMTGQYGAGGASDASVARGDSLLGQITSPDTMIANINTALREIDNRRYSQDQAIRYARQYIHTGGQSSQFGQPFETQIPDSSPLSPKNPNNPTSSLGGAGNPYDQPASIPTLTGKTPEERDANYAALPPGKFIGPDGHVHIKPAPKVQ